MPEKPKKGSEAEKETSAECEEVADTWEEDQKEHNYYYDDAHGYEVYEEENDDEETEPPESDI